MDRLEAEQILKEHLALIGGRSHAELARLVESKEVEVLEVPGQTGTIYQVEVQFVWDNRRGDAVRVIGSIDDGGIRAFFPITQTLLVSASRET